VKFEFKTLDADEAALLFMAGRVRHPAILPPDVEAAYGASVKRRAKASRKDYGAGYEDGHDSGYREGYQQALDDLKNDLLGEVSDAVPDVRLDDPAA